MSQKVIFSVLNDLGNSWQKKERDLYAALKDVQGNVGVEESEIYDEEVRRIVAVHAELVSSIRNLHGKVEKKDEMLDVVKQKINTLGSEIRKVYGDELVPIGRCLPSLDEQNKGCDELLRKADEKEKLLDELALEWQQITENGVVTVGQKNAVVQQLNELKGDISKQRIAIMQRKRMIGNTQLALQEFVWSVFCHSFNVERRNWIVSVGNGEL